MKPKFRSLIAAFAPLSRSSLIVVTSICAATSAHADQTWTGAVDALWTTPGNWNASIPGAGDVAVFNSTSANLATTLNGDFSVLGVKVADPSAAVSIGVAGTLTLGASGIDMSTATQNLAVDAAATTGAAQTWTVGAGRTLAMNGILTNVTALTKAGTGILSLTNNGNVTTGGLVAAGGTLRAGSNINFGTGGTGAGIITIQGGATVDTAFAAGNTWVCANPFDIPAGQTGILNSPNRMRMNGAVTGSGILNFNVITNTSRMDLQSTWAGFTGELNFTGGGTVRLGINALASNQPNFAAAGWAATKVNIGGTVSIAPNTSGPGNTVSIGSLAGTSATGLGDKTAGGTATWSIGGLNLDSIYDGGILGVNNVTKVGSGILTLTNATALTYAGATTVSEGTLKINGVKSGTGATTVAVGATLTGTGSLAGTTTIAAGSTNTTGGTLSPGDGGVGNITFSNLTLATGSILNLQFGAGNDKATVSTGGTLTLASGISVDVNGFDADGTYTIIDVTGATVSGSASTAFTVINGNPSKTYSFVASGSAVQMTVSGTDPSNYWSFDGAGSWATPGNWSKGVVPNVAGAIAKFGPGPGGAGGLFNSSFAVALDGNKTIGLLSFNDDFGTIFTVDPGTGTPGTLLLDNGALASEIVVVLGDPVINAPVAIDAQGLAVSATGSLTMNGIVSGTGAAFTKNGAGNLFLTADNTYDGGTVLGAGVIGINSATSLGAISGPATFSGGTLQLSAALSGITRSYRVTGANNALINTNGNDFGYGGVISPVGAATGGLTKSGAGIMTISAAQTYTGTTALSAGGLEIATGGSTNGGATNVTGGTLSVTGGSLTASALSSVNAGSLAVSAGTVALNAGLNCNTSNATSNYFINLTGGNFSASAVTMGRLGVFYDAAVPPAAGLVGNGFYVNGGVANITGNLSIGSSSNTNSTANARIDSGSLTVGGAVFVQVASGARWSILDVNGGTFTNTDTVTGTQIGSGLIGSSAFLVRAGTATIERILLTQAATSTETSHMNVSGGSLYVGAGGIVGNNNAGTGILDVQLGTGTLGAKANWSTLLGATLNGGTIVKASDAANAAHDITIGGVLVGTGGLEKTGAGTLTLSGANTYAGTTTITEGKLAIAGNQSGAIGDVSVASGAALGGNGDIGGNVTVASGGRQSFPVSASPGVQPVRHITGTLTLTGNTLLDLTSSGPVSSGVYNLATASSIIGTPPVEGNYNGLKAVISVTGGNTLVVTITASDFDTWISGFTFPAGADLTATGDPDGDGVTNQEEYAFGLIPNSGSSVNPITAQLDKATGLFTYTRRKPSLTGLVYVYQYSTSLGSWTNFTPDSTSSNNGDPVEAVTVDVPNALLANPKLFVRVTAQ